MRSGSPSRWVRWFAALLAVVLLGGPARAEPDDPVADACHGVISELLGEFRDGDDAQRAAAEARLRARARFALPYVLSAAESTADEAYRARCRALADALRPLAGEDADVAAAARAEFPAWETTASTLLATHLYAMRPPNDERRLEAVLDKARIREARRDAAQQLYAYAVEHPERLLEALHLASHRAVHRTALPDIARLEAFALERAALLPPAEQAPVALALALWGRGDRVTRLEEMARRFAGTPESLRAEVALIRASDAKVLERVRRFMALADAHPGTEAAFEALDTVAFHLASSNLSQAIPNRRERFGKLAAIAARLQSEEFGGPKGCLAAVRHLNECYLGYLDAIPEAEAQGLLPAYRTFFASHALLDVLGGEGSTVEWSMPHKLGLFLKSTGVAEDQVDAAVDGELSKLADALPDPAGLHYLRAERKAQAGDVEGACEAFTALEEAFPGTLYARKALAAKAGVRQATGDLVAAEALWTRYVERHPQSPFAWLAAVRVGHCRFLRGEVHGALTAYAEARAGPAASHPLLAILLPIMEGRCLETTGEIARAVATYRRALAAWPTSGLDPVGTAPQPLSETIASVEHANDPEQALTRAALEAHVQSLDRPGADPTDMARLARGRQLARQGDVDGALRLWEAILADRPDGLLAADARESIAGAWLVRAKDVVDRSKGTPDEETARAHLEHARAAGDRFGILAAAFVDAGLRLRTDTIDAASVPLGKAFETYAASQVFEVPPGALAETVAAIRVEVFAPHPELYRFNEKRTPGSAAYVGLTSTTLVIHTDGRKEELELRPAHPSHPKALYFTGPQLGLLARLIEALGAVPESAEGEAAPAVKGSADDVARLLGRFVAVQHGHWGGWLIGAFPMVFSVRLDDADHATARYRIGYTGGDAKLALIEGSWRLVETTNQWIE